MLNVHKYTCVKGLGVTRLTGLRVMEKTIKGKHRRTKKEKENKRKMKEKKKERKRRDK